MAALRKILNRLAERMGDRRGVSSVEYAILAVGIVIVVGGAINAFNLLSPMEYAGNNLLDSQGALTTPAR